MKKSIFPQSYEEWRHFITVDCGLDLTPNFISERIESLQNNQDFHTQQFVKSYGQEYHQKVLAWFMQEQKEYHS